MLHKKWAVAVLGFTAILGEVSGEAHAALQSGVAYGFGQLQQFPSMQGSTALRFRLGLPIPNLFATLDLEGRSQSLAPSRLYVYETNGLALGLMAEVGWLRVGATGSGNWLRQITTDDPAADTLKFASAAGWLIEPCIALAPPFARLGNAQIEFSFHYPLLNWLDPAISPRIMMTLWNTGNPTSAVRPAVPNQTPVPDSE